MPSAFITVDIELKPYLKKYLKSKSLNKKFPLKIHNRHDYNVLLLRLVTNYNSLTSIPLEDNVKVAKYFGLSKQSMQTDSISKGVGAVFFDQNPMILIMLYIP